MCGLHKFEVVYGNLTQIAILNDFFWIRLVIMSYATLFISSSKLMGYLGTVDMSSYIAYILVNLVVYISTGSIVGDGGQVSLDKAVYCSTLNIAVVPVDELTIQSEASLCQ